MLITEKVEIKGNGKNIKHYTNKGYNIKNNQILEVYAKDLPNMSSVLVEVECDICGNKKEIMYKSYYRNIEKYGFYTCSSKCSEVKCKMTNKNNHGVEYPTQSKEVIQKRKQNNFEKYGVDEASKLKEIKDKIKKTKFEKYGDENFVNTDKCKITKLERYGNENYNNREKSNNTCLEKYNVDNVSKVEEIKDKKKDKFMKNYGVENYSMSEEYKNKNKEFLLNKYKDINIIDIVGDDIILKCDCGKEHNYTINKFALRNRLVYKTTLCTICNPLDDKSSGHETKLLNFIKENYDGEIIENSRNIISPYELDIYLPELNLAFEFNGVYWHNELFKEKYYHRNKSNLCDDKDIHLIYIWEDDWIHRESVVKSMIMNKLGKSDRKIYARKCELREVKNSKEARKFLDSGHVQGFIGSKIKLGLYYENELVSIMTLGVKRVSQNSSSGEGEYELLRYCNKANTNVIGGASKLFKYFVKNYNPKEIITYADRSYSKGNLYKTLGFEFVHKTDPNYYYVVNGIRKHRFGFRKDVLVKDGYDPNMSEHNIMLSRKIYRVFNAGNYKFVYKNNNYIEEFWS